MPVMTVVMDVEKDGHGPMRYLAERVGASTPQELIDSGQLIHLTNEISVGALEHGMESGAAAVSFCFELPDGRVVLAETSLALLQSVTLALTARYGTQ